MVDAPQEATPEDGVRDHLEEVEDGCGCTEVWEYLSERRATEE